MNTAPTNPADARARLLEIIKDKAIVHGRVTLSSGKEADYYVDLRRITLDGEAAPLVGIVMRDLTRDLAYDAVGGLTLGADPVATSMLHASAAAGERLDAFVVRKAGKAHGLTPSPPPARTGQRWWPWPPSPTARPAPASASRTRPGCPTCTSTPWRSSASPDRLTGSPAHRRGGPGRRVPQGTPEGGGSSYGQPP